MAVSPLEELQALDAATLLAKRLGILQESLSLSNQATGGRADMHVLAGDPTSTHES